MVGVAELGLNRGAWRSLGPLCSPILVEQTNDEVKNPLIKKRLSAFRMLSNYDVLVLRRYDVICLCGLGLKVAVASVH